jgi:hypothetical protein
MGDSLRTALDNLLKLTAGLIIGIPISAAGIYYGVKMLSGVSFPGLVTGIGMTITVPSVILTTYSYAVGRDNRLILGLLGTIVGVSVLLLGGGFYLVGSILFKQ